MACARGVVAHIFVISRLASSSSYLPWMIAPSLDRRRATLVQHLAPPRRLTIVRGSLSLSRARRDRCPAPLRRSRAAAATLARSRARSPQALDNCDGAEAVTAVAAANVAAAGMLRAR